MTLHIAVLGVELITLTLDFDHDVETTPDGEPQKVPLKRKAKQAAGWWALK